MPKKKKALPKEKSQKQRFLEKARELGVDESGAEFERAFDQVVRKPQGRHRRPTDGEGFDA